MPPIHPDTFRALLLALLIMAVMAFGMWHFGRWVEPTSVRNQAARPAGIAAPERLGLGRAFPDAAMHNFFLDPGQAASGTLLSGLG